MSRVRARMVSRIAEALSSREFLRSSGFFTGLNLGIGALVGAVIVSFIVVTEWLTEVMIHGQALGAVRFAAPVLGALAAGFLMHRWFGEARGSGIPQTKAALVANDGRIPFRTAFGKYVCGVLTLGAGIPLGREGPSAQIGAGIASSVGEALGLDTEQRRQLIPVGTAAAIAAAFNTPIAAILFSLEEIVGNLHARVLGSVVLSAVASWLVLRLSLGDEPLFSVPAYELGHPAELLIYAVLGVLGGLMSVGFVRTLLWLRAQIRRLPVASRWFQPALGGVAVAAAWLLLPGFFEVGYGPVGEALAGELPIGRMAVLLAIHLVLVGRGLRLRQRRRDLRPQHLPRRHAGRGGGQRGQPLVRLRIRTRPLRPGGYGGGVRRDPPGPDGVGLHDLRDHPELRGHRAVDDCEPDLVFRVPAAPARIGVRGPRGAGRDPASLHGGRGATSRWCGPRCARQGSCSLRT